MSEGLKPEGPVLGELAKGIWGRDAIHVAVVPMIAAERLRPGQHVCFAAEGNYELASGLPQKGNLGIVDPFLTEDVLKGQQFWMCLYPNTVTSLRHQWTHPAFTPKIPGKKDDRT